MKNVINLMILQLLVCSAHAQITIPTYPDSLFPTYYHQRVTHFKSLPATKDDIIFVGNSITDGAEWSELFNDLHIKNRGISGDVTAGVLHRLAEVADRKPAAVFLLIGVNDLSRGISADSVLKNIKTIVQYVHQTSPATKLYVQSLLPVNTVFGKFQSHTNKGVAIHQINQALAGMADALDFQFIPLHDAFSNAEGRMDTRYTNDGLHLTGEGYLLWKHLIFPYLYNVPEKPGILPKPQQLTWNKGRFSFAGCENIWVKDSSLMPIARSMQNAFSANGKMLRIIQQKPANGTCIELVINKSVGQEKPDGAYRLNIDSGNISISSPAPQGVFYGWQTLRQILRDGVMADACTIEDWPSFSWRGYMVDVGRNYQSMDLLKQQIDIMSKYKMNIFHFHPTEDIAWRLEVPGYPELTAPENMLRDKGLYYTQSDIDELIAYCKERFITLVPEIDMPGHSAAFKRGMKTEMQSDTGLAIVKNILRWFSKRFDVPYIHIGADEVKIYNQQFIPEVTALLDSLGREVIGWQPGGNFSPSTIRQLWMEDQGQFTSGKGIRYIDSRHLYLNHMDPLESVVTIFFREIAGRSAGDKDALGGIVCLWHDRAAANEYDLINMNAVYPAMLSFAERSWDGGGQKKWKATIGAPGSEAQQAFAEFENRLMEQRKFSIPHVLFPYARQANLDWKLYGPFENKGVLEKQFPPETEKAYLTNTKPTELVTGGTIILRHWWASLINGALPNPQPNTTWYATTRIWADEAGIKSFWIGFSNPSRSQNTDSPMPGTWDNRKSELWVNGKMVAAPNWHRAGQKGHAEIPLIDESYESRPPTLIPLQKGWNEVLVKLPIASFKEPNWHNPVKWMFTFVPVDGKK